MAHSRPLVVVSETLDPHCADWLAERVELRWHAHDAAGFSAALAEADGLVVRTYTRVDGDLLEATPNLKVIGRAGVGLDNIDLEACRDRGVMVVSTPQANTQAVVEYVFALMFDALRPRDEIGRGTAAERFHALRRERVGTQLSALTLGIVGFGRIGRRVGQVAHAIGMNLVVNDLLPEADLRKAVDYPFAFVDKPALLAGSDVVTLHVDGRAGNRGLIDATLLSHLRSTALLINTARGFVVDAGALAEWAGRYPQARVVLDVHEPEPPPADYPLHGLANVRLLPHLASRTTQALENMSWVVRDVVAVLQGEAPEHPA